MPVMKREEWLRLSPDEKVLHYVQRTIDRLESLQARYDRDRLSGKLAKPIPFLKR